MQHFNIFFEPDNKQVSIHSGATIAEAASKAGIILNMVCGGRGTCGKCEVVLKDENKRVYACKHIVDRDLSVIVPDESRFYKQQILMHGVEQNIEITPIISSKDGCEKESIFGVAVDIGTTTVVAKLVDMRTGSIKAVSSSENPQAQFGADVIARITHGSNGEGLTQMHKVIIDCVNELIEHLCSQADISTDDICELTAAGNTTMNHIFLNYPIEQLGRLPFEAHSLDSADISPQKLGIKINPKGNIHTIANIAGFLGADTTAVALAVGMDKTDKMTLVIDIGTNGELIIGNKDKMYAASCAAGPAFEGAKISQGGRAVPGAIQSVLINSDDIEIDVIGGGTAKSICGSGLIDTMAVLVELGIIDYTGRFLEKDDLQGKLPEKILNRIVNLDGKMAFMLADNTDKNLPCVYFTQNDVRESQLAKAAMRAGIILLQKKLGIADSQIDQVLLAGAFGNYIRRESAKRIGLLPDVEIQKVKFVGNAASTGALMVLLNAKYRQLASELAKKIEHLELANSSDFTYVYAECMMFDYNP